MVGAPKRRVAIALRFALVAIRTRPDAAPAAEVVDDFDVGEEGATERRRSLRPPSWEKLRPLLPHLPVAALMVAYTIYFSRLTIDIYRGYGSPGFDLGIYDQGLWLMSRFHAPFVTIMGRNLFGDHASLILLLLVPLYWVLPSAPALLVVQSAALALGALPVYLLGRDRLKSTVLATLLAGAFLLHPALQGGNTEQFHPECLLVPLIGFAIYYAVKWDPRKVVLFAILCLLVKEDVAILILPLGLWIYVNRDRRLGRNLVAGALLAALISVRVVMAGIAGVPELHADRIPFGGWHGFRTTVLRKPGKLVDYLTGDRRPFYVWQMLVPSAWAFLRAPSVAAIAAVALAANVLSTFGYQHQLQFHYSLPMVPVVAIGTAYAIGAIVRARFRVLVTGAVVLLSLWTCYLWGSLPAFSVNKVAHWSPSYQTVHDIDAVRASLPPNAVVSAYYAYITHVDHRQRVYEWPTPFKAAYWGLLKQEGQRLPFANDVQYIFLPARLEPNDQKLLDSLTNYRVIRTVGDSQLLKRVP